MNCTTCRGEEKQQRNANARDAASREAWKSRHFSFTTTSVNQTRELEEALGLLPDNGVKCWCDLHSVEALRLSLPHIIESCKLPNQHILEEYPYSKYLTPLGTVHKISPSSPAKPQAHLDEDKLRQKQRQLKLLIKFYENRIHNLSNGSNRYFGVIQGSKVAILIEASQALAKLEDGKKFEEYKNSLKLLVREQLINKEAVYFIQFGTEASPHSPEPLPFEVSRSQCKSFADQWLTALNGQGSCNLLAALKVALTLQEINTVCVVLSTHPNQDLALIHDHLTDKLTGYRSPKVHLVTFDSSKEISSTLSTMATTLKGQFHSYSTFNLKRPGSSTSPEHKTFSVEDTDIDCVRKEIEKTKQVIHDLHNLQHGVVKDPLLSTLRELSLTTKWVEDDDFQLPTPPTEHHALPCSSLEWLEHNGLEWHGLNLYKVLAPNAYPQLDGHVQITDSRVLSLVYDVMPLFAWHDGTHKYLHVDVNGLEHYIRLLESFIEDTLQPCLRWLLSGSRMSFGILTEHQVLLVMDSSFPVLAEILTLQQHMKTLLEEQLSLVEEFNLMRFGKDCGVWTTGFAEPSRHSLKEAWEFVLGMSPSGTSNLLSALRVIFETDQFFGGVEDQCTLNEAGIYLILSTMPDQDEEIICGYLEQQLTGLEVKVHVVYYDLEPLTHGLVIPGREGGRYGSSEEVEECLKGIARTTGGRFHHFKISDYLTTSGATEPGSAEGDDIKIIMAELSLAHHYLETANNILEHYREFCKRNVPSLEPACVSPQPIKLATPPPPLHPRPTTASIARMNACQQKLSSSSGDPVVTFKRRDGKKKFCLKTQPFYTGHGLKKAITHDLLEKSPSTKSKPLIPNKEEYITSKDWLSKYGLDVLRIDFEELFPSNKFKGTLYKHINPQGEVIELTVSHKGLKNYVTQLLTVLNRYQTRIEWLQEDKHKYFGAILESKVILILDASSSMSAHWPEVTNGLKKLLRDFPPHVKSFNLLVYTSTVKKWKDKLVVPANLEEALVWLDSIKTGGSSCLLEAVKAALFSRAEGIYLITDGQADHTHEFLLNQLPKLRQQFGALWILNTIAFQCINDQPNSFLRTLANKTGGRFHSYPQLSLGDDMNLLENAIQTTKNCVCKARHFL